MSRLIKMSGSVIGGLAKKRKNLRTSSERINPKQKIGLAIGRLRQN
jgi:hypothetical protein